MSRFESEVSRLPGQNAGDIGGGHGGTSPLRGDVPPRCVPFVPGQMSRPMSRNAAADRDRNRFLMPNVAAWLDQLRQWAGRDVIDQALRTQRFVASDTGPDGVLREIRRNESAAPAMVVTRKSWGYRA